jgi:hypothetical protein
MECKITSFVPLFTIDNYYADLNRSNIFILNICLTLNVVNCGALKWMGIRLSPFLK